MFDATQSLCMPFISQNQRLNYLITFLSIFSLLINPLISSSFLLSHSLLPVLREKIVL